uniref:Uncharacterized protein n=1 Tax=Pseudomonas fluorescens (strain SBW25) TaxID=216595 RepID=A0A0G4E4N2_PSEFS|nr:hypothetical protein PQBR57_0243 [Pseudomonas fluorescens SBW25]
MHPELILEGVVSLDIATECVAADRAPQLLALAYSRTR